MKDLVVSRKPTNCTRCSDTEKRNNNAMDLEARRELRKDTSRGDLKEGHTYICRNRPSRNAVGLMSDFTQDHRN